MGAMEGDGIDREDKLHALLPNTVTLEGILPLCTSGSVSRYSTGTNFPVAVKQE